PASCSLTQRPRSFRGPHRRYSLDDTHRFVSGPRGCAVRRPAGHGPPGDKTAVSNTNPFVRGLSCRVCGRHYDAAPINFCTDDFGPLEVAYDYDAIRAVVDRAKIEARPRTMWRYAELLPLDGEPTVGVHSGGTPLVK